MNVPNSPQELGFLSYTKWRRYQREALQKAVDSDGDNIALEMPTGAGKSLCAASLLELTGESGIILVHTKSLQSQYLRDFDMATIMGRNNYQCVLRPGTTCDLGPCMVSSFECPESGSCTYLLAKRRALAAKVIVTNYPYFLRAANFTGEFRGRGWIICDEGHLVENEMLQFVNISLNRHFFQRVLGVNLPGFLDLTNWREWGKANEPSVGNAAMEAEKMAAESMYNVHMVKRAQDLSRLTRSLHYLQSIDDGWFVEVVPTGMRFRPTWVKGFVEPYLTRHAKKVLFMSATILSGERFASTLGIRDLQFIRTPSTFPKERRPLIYIPAARLSSKVMNTELPKLVDMVDFLLRQYPNGRGLIHTVNYQIRDYLLENSKMSDNMIVHDVDTREKALNEFVNGQAPGYLTSPSMNIGVDLPFLDFQIICKLSFPDLRDKQVARRIVEDPKWYAWDTCCGTIQTYGRGCRSADRYVPTYLLDSNWSWFFRSNRSLMPDWFTEAIITQVVPKEVNMR